MKTKAFSLLELLLAVSLLAVLGSVLFNFFGSAKKTYRRLQGMLESSEPFEQAGKVFQHDLARILVIQNQSLVGTAASLYFHAWKNETTGGISRVEYRFSEKYDEAGKLFRLERTEFPYPYDPEKISPQQTPCVLFDNARKLSFRYLIKASAPPEPSLKTEPQTPADSPDPVRWISSWKFPHPPLALSLNIRTRENENSEWRFWLPQARAVDFQSLPSVPDTLLPEEGAERNP